SVNNGFLLQLVNETQYRSVLFASSDNADSNLWPELEIEYVKCDASFYWDTETNNTGTYTFVPNNAYTSYYTYNWTVNGVSSPGPNLIYNFPPSGPTTYNICL